MNAEERTKFYHYKIEINGEKFYVYAHSLSHALREFSNLNWNEIEAVTIEKVS